YPVSAKHALLLPLSTKCARRRLAEQSLVVDREPPEVPEAKLRRDGRYSCRIGRRLTQRPSRLMHAAQQKVALWARSQILLAAHAQRSLRDPDRLADLQDVEWFSRVLLNRPAKAMHDNCMLRSRQALPVILLEPRQSIMASIMACSSPCAASG